MIFRAGVGAPLSDKDDCELLKCRLHHSVDEYSSRLRVDDLRYLDERPGLYDEFDYVIYNEDFFHCRERPEFDGVESSSSSSEFHSPHNSMVSTRSCSELAEHSESLSFGESDYQQFEQQSKSIGGPPLNNNGISSALPMRCSSELLPHYASPQAIELEFFLKQKFGDRHGYYPLIGLHSYIPRRLLWNGILDVLYELAMNMVSFMAGKGGECLIDLTNSIFVVKNITELSYIDEALAKYSRWIAETQTHASRSQIPFANDVIQYTIQGAAPAASAPVLCLEREDFSGDQQQEEDELLIPNWLDHLVCLSPAGRRDKALYVSALKYILFAS